MKLIQNITLLIVLIEVIIAQQQKQKNHTLEDLVIYNQNFTIVYPEIDSTPSVCGLKHSQLLNHSQKFIVSFNRPFIVTAYAQQQHKIQISGLSYSFMTTQQAIKNMIKAAELSNTLKNSDQKTINRYMAQIFLTRMCVSNQLTYSYFDTILQISQIPQADNQLVIKDNYLLGRVKIESLTYCTNLQNVINLQQGFNGMYRMLLITIIALIPVFPINRKKYFIFLIFLFVGIMESHILVFLYLNAICYFTNVRTNQLQSTNFPYNYMNQLKISCRAFTSIVICYDSFTIFAFIFNIFESNQFVSLYPRNFLIVMAAFTLYGNFFWLNRFKHLFWYMIMIYFLLRIPSNLQIGTLKNIIYYPIAGCEPSSFFTIFVPTIIAPTCQTSSIIYPLLIFPICVYSRKIISNNIIGVFMLQLAVLFDNEYIMVSYWLTWALLIICWLIDMCSGSGMIQSVRRTIIDKNTLNWLQ